MSDLVDKANEVAQHRLDMILNNHKKLTGKSKTHCQVCDEPIPKLRQNTIKGCTRCVDCQALEELKNK